MNPAKNLPNHLAIYIRVSTDKQKAIGLSSENQLEKGIEKANQLGWTYSVYDDSGLSGSISWFERPGIRKLMGDIQVGKIGGLFSTDIDRWSRDSDYIEPQVLITKFKEAQIKIFTLTGTYDFNDASVELSSRIKGVFASYERIQTRMRIITNLERSMLKGNNAGGGQLVPFGYDRVDKKLVVNKEEAKIVKLIFNLYIQGNGTQSIAGILNDKKIPTKRNRVKDGHMLVKKGIKKDNNEFQVIKQIKKGEEFIWRDTVIYNILKNTIYIGQKKYKNLFIPAPRIIEDDIFNTVQVYLKQKNKFKKEIINKFLLKGLVRCGKCGKSYYGHKRKDLKDKAYKCLSHRYKDSWCGNRGIDIDFLENLVWDSLEKFESHLKMEIELEVSKRPVENELLEEFKHKLSLTHKHVVNLERRYNEGNIKKGPYENLLKEYESEIKLLEERIKTISDSNYIYVNKTAILNVFSEFTKRVKKAKTFEDKQSIVRGFVEQVIITTNPENKSQDIIIYYKVDEFSQMRISKNIAVKYKANWQRIMKEIKPIRVSVITEKRDDGSASPFVTFF